MPKEFNQQLLKEINKLSLSSSDKEQMVFEMDILSNLIIDAYLEEQYNNANR